MNKHARRLWNWKNVVLGLIALAPILIGAAMYSELPDQFASHFGINGEVNGYMSKPIFFFFLLLINIVVITILKAAPKFDPKREDYAEFMDVYELLQFVIITFLNGVFVMVLLYNLGYDISMNKVIFLFMGVLWIIFGNYMGRIRQNYTLGIRTPWTLASEEVWRRTHRLAAPLWVLCGLVMIVVGMFSPAAAMSCIGVSVVIPIIYSYLAFKKLSKSKEK